MATTLPSPIKRNAARPSGNQFMMATQLMVRVQRGKPDVSCLK